MGDLYNSSAYLWFSGLVREEQGDFNELRRTISVLFELGEAYDSSGYTNFAHHLKADFLIITRAREALAEAEECFLYSREKSTELHVLTSLGRKAEALILLDDHEGAEESLSQAKAYYEKQRLLAPIFAVPYLAARFLADIHQLEMTIGSENSSNRAHFRKQAYQDGKAAVRKSRKYAPYRTKIFRLMGLYFWLIGKQRQALTWWTRTIQEGERLGAHPTWREPISRWASACWSPTASTRNSTASAPRNILIRPRSFFERWTSNGTWINWSEWQGVDRASNGGGYKVFVR